MTDGDDDDGGDVEMMMMWHSYVQTDKERKKNVYILSFSLS